MSTGIAIFKNEILPVYLLEWVESKNSVPEKTLALLNSVHNSIVVVNTTATTVTTTKTWKRKCPSVAAELNTWKYCHPMQYYRAV